MAVSGQEQPNLAPSYAGVTRQLESGADLESKRVPLTSSVAGAVNDTTDYAKKLSQIYLQHNLNMQAEKMKQDFESRGDVTITPEIRSQFQQAFGVDIPMPDGAHVPAEQVENFRKTINATAEKISNADKEGKLSKLLQDPHPNDPQWRGQAVSLMIGTGKENTPLYQALSSGLKPQQDQKPVVSPDPSSSTGYRYQLPPKTEGAPWSAGPEAPPPGAGKSGQQPRIRQGDEDKLLALNDVGQQVSDAAKNYDKSFVGALDGRTNGIKQMIPGFADDKRAAFLQAINGMTNEELRRRYGTRLTANEVARYGLEGPNVNKSEVDFKRRLAGVAKSINGDIQTRLKSAQSMGVSGIPEVNNVVLPHGFDPDQTPQAPAALPNGTAAPTPTTPTGLSAQGQAYLDSLNKPGK